MMTEQACHKAQLMMNMSPVSQFDMRKALAVWQEDGIVVQDRVYVPSILIKSTVLDFFLQRIQAQNLKKINTLTLQNPCHKYDLENNLRMIQSLTRK